MKFAWLSQSADTLDVALRTKAEGNQVRLYIQGDPKEKPDDYKADREIGDGLIEKVNTWQASAYNWADVVVIDAKGKRPSFDTGKIADQLRKAGKLVVGAGRVGERLELDRHFGQDVLKKAGVQIIPTVKFKDFKAAVQHIKENPKRYVFKPNADVDSELTYISKFDDGSDLVDEIEHFKSLWPKDVPLDFELQEFQKGVEIDCGGYFSGQDWLRPLWVQFEHKKIAAGDEYNKDGMGFGTGEMGSTHFWSPEKYPKIFSDTLEKVRPWLAKQNIHAWCDVNCIVNEKGVWPLEWTIRFGIPETHVNGECQKEDWGSVLLKIASGQGKDFEAYMGEWGIVVQMVGEGFPFADMVTKYMKDKQIPETPQEQLEHLHLEWVKKSKKGELVNAGRVGIPFCMTARDKTLDGARKKVYKLMGDKASSIYWYRPDIGTENLKKLEELKTLGYDFQWPK